MAKYHAQLKALISVYIKHNDMKGCGKHSGTLLSAACYCIHLSFIPFRSVSRSSTLLQTLNQYFGPINPSGADTSIFIEDYANTTTPDDMVPCLIRLSTVILGLITLKLLFSTFLHVMACCQQTPSHCLAQIRFIITVAWWHLLESIFHQLSLIRLWQNSIWWSSLTTNTKVDNQFRCIDTKIFF